MTVLQKPAAYSLTSTMADIIITGDESLNFVVSFEGEDILDEDYDPDATRMITIRDLGKIMERYLSGSIITGKKPSNYGVFKFKVDGVEIGETLALLCRALTGLEGSAFHELQYPLHLLHGAKTTIPTSRELISFCMHVQDNLTASVQHLSEGVILQSESKVLATATEASVYTFEVTISQIIALFPEIIPANILAYEVGVGDIKSLFNIDWSPYVDTKVFRYLNSFSCPTTLVTRGEISRKRGFSAESSKINGLEQRHAIRRSDLFTVSVGRKFSRADEALFAEMVISEQVQIYYRGAFRDIIPTEENSDEIQRRGAFSESSFSFRFADEKINTMLFDPTWILEDGTWNDWGNWMDEGYWND